MEAYEFIVGLNAVFTKFWVWLEIGLVIWAGFWVLGCWIWVWVDGLWMWAFG